MIVVEFGLSKFGRSSILYESATTILMNTFTTGIMHPRTRKYLTLKKFSIEQTYMDYYKDT